tara:strand:- start:23 stop:514 length:492 start_codon:yes stop_codon:yes gene_type:complete
MNHVVERVPTDEINSFFSVCSTIAGYIIFPSKKIDNKMTINGARGVNHKIQDRFDLTLECIRRFYSKKPSPLSDPLTRYSQFFNLFNDFEGYINFFLLQDLVKNDYSGVKFWHPFNNFNNSPLPETIDAYRSYKMRVIAFIEARNERILNFANQIDYVRMNDD